MSIWVPIDKLSVERRKKIAEDLTIIQLDESLEKMKKRGIIMPGYSVDPTSKIECFNLDSSGNLHVPYYYASKAFKLTPSMGRFSYLDENIENEITLKDEQVPVVESCFEDLMDHGTTTVGLPPGFGKTYIGAYLSHCMKLKVIVVVPRMTLVKQWKTTFNIGLPKAFVWAIDDKGRLPEGFDVNGEPPDVIISLDPRICKIPQKWKDKMGMMIIDEAHMLPTRSRIDNLLSIRPRYIIMETATMERGDGLHKGCQLIGGTHGYFKTSKDPYKFNIVDLGFIKADEEIGFRGVNYGALCNELSINDEYNTVIVNIVKSNPDNKFIILTKRVNHGDILKELFIKSGITADSMMGSKKTYVNSRVLIGTFSKMGTGFDESTATDDFKGPKSDSLIICHSVAKTPNFEQYRGRVMRVKNPSVYWLNVKNPVIRNQLTGIKKHVVSTNGTIVHQDGSKYLDSKTDDI